MKSLSERNKGIIYVLIAATMWSFGGILIKNIDAPAAFIALGRSAVAFITLSPFIKLRKIKNIKKLIILSLGYTTCLTSFVLSTKMTAAANAIAIQSSSPLYIFLGLWIFRKQFDKTKILPMLMILFGIIAFLLEPQSGTNIKGNLIAMVSGISFSILILFFGEDYGLSGLGLTSLLNLFVVPVVAFMVPWNEAPYIMDAKSWVLLILLGSVQIGLAYVFFYAGRTRIPPVDSSILTLIEPILNPIWVFLSIGEKPTSYAFVGYFLILGALVITVIVEKRRALELNHVSQSNIMNTGENP